MYSIQSDHTYNSNAWQNFSNYINLISKPLKSYLKPIPKSDRDRKICIVITGQFISMNHGPTKSTIDRCYILQKYLGYKVYLINTADLLNTFGEIAFYGVLSAGYSKDAEKANFVEHNGEIISYYQSRFRMSDMSEIRQMINFIIRKKPYLIVSMGGYNVFAELCNKIVPVLTVSLAYSTMPPTSTLFRTMNKKPDELDLKFLELQNQTTNNIIEGVFTTNFKDQTSKLTRKELRLPEDKFIIIVVGGRLDYEITDEFLKALTDTIEYNTFIAFAGIFDKYSLLISQNNTLKENSINLGFQEDMLAVLEVCDLYANSRRIGGGMSAVEALYKGVPVVTPDFGDAASNAGSEFTVNDYEHMTRKIIEYVTDKEYYKKMSEKSIEMTVKLLDSKKEFTEIIERTINNPLFF